MTSLAEKMHELRRIARLHANWLIYAALGESALTKEEVTELTKYGKLPMGKTLDLVDRSYLLGRLKAILKRSEYSGLSYEELSDRHVSISDLEELIIEQARQRTNQYLRDVANDMTTRAFDAMNVSLETTIAQAVGKTESVADLQKRSMQQFASTLAAKLESSDKSRWQTIAMTEMHRSKIAGVVQAISNKHDIYANSGGVESLVSIVPAPGCEDCQHHYLDGNGNPLVFKLLDLMSNGSNADNGATHTRSSGIHVNWKPTLPPLHPNCGCQLVYVAPGYGWENGKLTLIHKSLFQEHIAKARSGVSGGITPTVEPKGPPQEAKPPTVPSMPGAAAPNNPPGPGRPRGATPFSPFSKVGAGGGKTGSAGLQYVSCPFGGGNDCIKHGGNGAAQHKANGAIMKAHQDAISRGAKPTTPEAKEAHRTQMEAAAKIFNAENHPEQVVKDHLAEGEIGSMKKLGGEEAGKNASFKITIVGNGSGLMKPHVDPMNNDVYLTAAHVKPTDTLETKQKAIDGLTFPGAGTMPKGMNPKAEVGTHKLASALGIAGVPVTTLRHHDGSEDGPTGLTSVQHWQDDAVSTTEYTRDVDDNPYKALMKSVPKEHKDKMHEQLASIAVMDAITNNGDRHFGNLMVKKDKHDIVAIDHGMTFGNGMSGMRNDIASNMHKSGVALTIPPKLHQRLKNISLDDTMRSLDESGLPEWAKAQTFLRMKYMSHLQDTHGHIPHEKIKSTTSSPTGAEIGFGKDWDDLTQYFKADEAGETPQKQFEGFAKAWMKKAASDPSHPDHEDAKRLIAAKPLRSNKLACGREETSDAGLDKHFDSIPDYDLSEPKKIPMQGKAKAWDQSQEVAIRTPPNVSTEKGTAVGKKKKKESSTPAGAQVGHADTAIKDLNLDLNEFKEGSEIKPEDMQEISPKEADDLEFDKQFDKLTKKSLRLYVRLDNHHEE